MLIINKIMKMKLISNIIIYQTVVIEMKINSCFSNK